VKRAVNARVGLWDLALTTRFTALIFQSKFHLIRKFVMLRYFIDDECRLYADYCIK